MLTPMAPPAGDLRPGPKAASPRKRLDLFHSARIQERSVRVLADRAPIHGDPHASLVDLDRDRDIEEDRVRDHRSEGSRRGRTGPSVPASCGKDNTRRPLAEVQFLDLNLQSRTRRPWAARQHSRAAMRLVHPADPAMMGNTRVWDSALGW